MREARPFSWLGSAVGAAVVNAALNAPLALLLVKPGGRLPMWGLPGVAGDVVAMAFGIGFGTGLVVTPQTRLLWKRGRVRPPEVPAQLRAMFNTWPNHLLHRSLNLGFISLILFAPIPLLALWLLGIQGLDRSTLLVLKGGFAAIEGAFVTPIIGAGAFFPEARE